MMGNHVRTGEGEPMESGAASDRVEAVTSLLLEAELHHGAYEAKDLGGVYDKDWPSWYAEYAIEHGLSDALGQAAPLDQVAPFLARAYDEFEQLDPRPDRGAWAGYVARRLLEEFSAS
jgi:hypothetical protein